MKQIRPIAICAFLRNNRILVAEGFDPVKDETFYRPLGGGIEFGNRKSILHPTGLMAMLTAMASA